jgi:hypothetical protein
MVIMTDRFDPKFLEEEQKFRQQAFRLHAQERELRKSVRRDVDLDDVARQEKYMRGYEGLNQLFEQIANEHGRWFFGQSGSRQWAV